MLALALLGCTGSDLGKTLVYALDATPQVELDRQTCGTDVGLDIPIGAVDDSLSMDIARDGSGALLGTCVLDDAGGVISCGTLLPEVQLELLDEGTVVGEVDVDVAFQDTLCGGATLHNTWTLLLDDDVMTGSLHVEWAIDDSNACEDFEADVIASSGNGRGIDGCLLDYPYVGSLVAKCEATATGFACEDP